MISINKSVLPILTNAYKNELDLKYIISTTI